MKQRTIPNEILIPEIAKLIKEGRNVTFLVKGYSMRPFLENARDKVILSPLNCAVKPGDVVLAEVGKQVYVLHRVINCSEEKITLLGDGNVFGTETCRPSDVIGIATGFYRKNRQKADMVSGKKWKIYSFLWMNTRFMRRYVLAIHRRLIKIKKTTI